MRHAALCRSGPPGTHPEKAGLRPDDLIVLLGDQLVPSCQALRAGLEYVDFEDEIRLTVLRGQDLIEVRLREGGEVKCRKLLKIVN